MVAGMSRRVARALLVAVMPALLIGVTTLRPAAAATTIRVPDSIDASGGTDVTASLNQFFASVPAGSTVELADHGRYRSEGVLRLTGMHDVTIEGNGSEIFAQTDGGGVAAPVGYKGHWPRLREHVAVRDANGLTLRDLAIQGPNEQGKYVVALEGQAGVSVARSENVLLDHLAVSHTYGDGVGLSGASRAVTVRDSTFDTIGRQGIAIVKATDVVVEGNHLQKIARSVFDIEAAARSTVQAVHLRDNDVGDYGNFLLAEGGAGPSVSDIWLEHNRVSGGNGIAVFAGMDRWLRHGLHVLDNTSAVAGRQVPNTSRVGVMQIHQIDGVEISGNRQPVTSGTVAVGLVDVCNLTMHDNAFPGASADKQQTGRCSPGGAAAASGGSGARAGGASGASSPASAKKKKGSTDREWMVAGLLAGAAALVILGQQALRKRARART
jgi:hypothetical protein